jgi:hypothetical protein
MEALWSACVTYDGSSPSSREVSSTAMTATKNNVPPSSTLVMTVLVLRTSQFEKTVHALRSFR